MGAAGSVDWEGGGQALSSAQSSRGQHRVSYDGAQSAAGRGRRRFPGSASAASSGSFSRVQAVEPDPETLHLARRATVTGDYDLLQSVITGYARQVSGGAGGGVPAVPPAFRTLLTDAIRAESLACLELLLQQYAFVVGLPGSTNVLQAGSGAPSVFPTHLAAQLGKPDALELTLSAGCLPSPNILDHRGFTVFHEACQAPDPSAAFQCLVSLFYHYHSSMRVPVSSLTDRDGNSLLQSAVLANHAGITRFLLTQEEVRDRNSRLVDNAVRTARNTPSVDPVLLKVLLGREDTPANDIGGSGRRRGRQRRQRRSAEGRSLNEREDITPQEMQRIMAVWERFFENAMRAGLGGGSVEPYLSQAQHGTQQWQQQSELSGVTFSEQQEEEEGKAEERGSLVGGSYSDAWQELRGEDHEPNCARTYHDEQATRSNSWRTAPTGNRGSGGGGGCGSDSGSRDSVKPPVIDATSWILCSTNPEDDSWDTWYFCPKEAARDQPQLSVWLVETDLSGGDQGFVISTWFPWYADDSTAEPDTWVNVRTGDLRVSEAITASALQEPEAKPSAVRGDDYRDSALGSVRNARRLLQEWLLCWDVQQEEGEGKAEGEQNPYYYNVRTAESSWEKPEDLHDATALYGGWILCLPVPTNATEVAELEEPYWYNEETMEAQWEPPWET